MSSKVEREIENESVFFNNASLRNDTFSWNTTNKIQKLIAPLGETTIYQAWSNHPTLATKPELMLSDYIVSNQ